MASQLENQIVAKTEKTVAEAISLRSAFIPRRVEITEANKEGIGAAFGTAKGGVNPCFDSAQLRAERSEIGATVRTVRTVRKVVVSRTGTVYRQTVRTEETEKTVTSADMVRTESAIGGAIAYRERVSPGTYRETVERFSARVAGTYVRRMESKQPCSHLFQELREEVMGEADRFLGERSGRFLRLAEDLLARFALGTLPDSTARNLRQSCLRACDKRLRRMAGRTSLVEPSFFHALPNEDAAEHDADAAVRKIRNRIAVLLRAVRAKGETGNAYAKRDARRHARFLSEVACPVLLASVTGESVKLPGSELTRKTRFAGYSHAAAFRPSVPGPIKTERTETRETEREATLSPSALYSRVRRLADFIGDAGIVRALAYSSRR